MYIQSGIHHKKFLGFKLKTRLPSFHRTFGQVSTYHDCDYDSGLTNFNQNEPNPIFGTPAQPNGCTGMCTTDVLTDKNKVVYNPYQCYTQTCLLEYGTFNNQEIQMPFALNEPLTDGVVDLNGNVYKTGQWYEIEPINGSLFTGICNALEIGQTSVSFAGTWYESFEAPDQDGVVTGASGGTSGHNWKICGIKTINNVQYLIAKPWLGNNWAQRGFCYFPQSILDSIGGQAFTPTESAGEIAVPATTQNILQELINLLTIELDKLLYGRNNTFTA